ncbi:hypothetical protein F8S13_27255 [Chloroflexia bacterium SDU3-3]|nr:hypothetical protein F8S13_27255 [Chloroflexia bacterium SDU3-3]
MEKTPAQLEDAEVPLGARINHPTLILLQDGFAQLVDPQHRNRKRQQQGIQPFGVGEPRVVQIKPTAFVIAEALLKVHPLEIVAQDPAISMGSQQHVNRP